MEEESNIEPGVERTFETSEKISGSPELVVENSSTSSQIDTERIQELRAELQESKVTSEVRANTEKIESLLEKEYRNKEFSPKKPSKFMAAIVAFSAFLSPLGDKENPEKTLKKETQALITQELGYDIEARAAQYGYKVSFDIKNPGGKYLVHIGQIHHSTDPRTGEVKWYEDQIASQKKIEKLLLSLPLSSETTVFTEGMTQKETHSEDILIAKDFYNLNFTLEKAGFTNEKGVSILRVLEKGIRALESASKNKTTFDHYLFTDALLKLTQTLRAKASTEFLNEHSTLETFETRIRIIQQTSGLTPEDMPYASGAVEKLHAEGKINLKGSETLEANARGGIALEAYQQAGTFLKKARTKSEIQTAEQALKESTELFEKYSKKEREAVAVEIIQRELDTSNEKIIPLVYGKAHDFRNQVDIKNSEHPEHKLGLITLKPIDE